MTAELKTFAARLREAIQSGFPATNFGPLAVELFALQFANNPAYRTLCMARGVTPRTLSHWSQVPAVPTAAFKELEITCLPPTERTHVFHSSGTTAQQPSRHFHNADSLAVYEASLWAWFAENCRWPLAAGRLVSLTPPPAQAGNSSLVHMFDFVRRKVGANPEAFVGRSDAHGAWTVDFDSACSALSPHDSCSRMVFGTAFAFVQLLDELVARKVQFELPPGSFVLETGGYKGRSRVLPKRELHALITNRLGVPGDQIICEYGMSELSSQAYDVAKGSTPGERHREIRTFQFPPWARGQIVSPETGCEVRDGETGLVRVFDLANVFSVLAVQTEDLAVRRDERLELIGRAEWVESRGCSLMTVDARLA